MQTGGGATVPPLRSVLVEPPVPILAKPKEDRRRQMAIKQTIYQALETKLGRTPTNVELKADVKRILAESLIEMAGKGQLPFQRNHKGGQSHG